MLKYYYHNSKDVELVIDEIKNFRDVFTNDSDYKNASLILGNGSSISLDEKFNYKYLYEYVQADLPQKCQNIFRKLNTNNFEYVMGKLYQTYRINDILDLDSDKVVLEQYIKIKNALIRAVQENHADYNVIARLVENKQIQNIYEFIQKFSTVINLNYDLMLYWILNSEKNVLYNTKDYFMRQTQHDGQRLLEFDYGASEKLDDTTKIFYPHGNLLFVTDRWGDEFKITACRSISLLSEISLLWNECTPLFISEGETSIKLRAIKRSSYLNYIYESILNNLGKTIVIYGWSMGEQDKHIIDKVFGNKNVEKVAVGVYIGDDYTSKEIESKLTNLKQTIQEKNQNIKVEFFDTTSEGCWNN